MEVTLSREARQAQDDPAEKKREDKRSALIAQARKHYQLVATTESVLRAKQLDDKRFRASEQWTDAASRERSQDDRPMLTINRLPGFIRQVTNQQRAANLSIQVEPVDNGADQETAEVFRGLIRDIEDQSEASVAYETAGDDQATIGRGYWKIDTEYTDDRAFTQELRIRRIRNAFSVYMDCTTDDADGQGARFCLQVEDIPKDTYIEKWGEGTMSGLADMISTGNASPDWMPEGKVRIAEYWYIDTVEETIVLMVDQRTGEEVVFTTDELDAMPPSLHAQLRERTRRDTRRKVVRKALINGVTILEGNADKTAGAIMPGKRIWVVPVIGDEIDINGQVDYRGIVRDAKDPQRLYNFESTALAEVVQLSPLAQWVGYAGQFQNHEQKWRQANRRRYPYLEVNAIDVNGQVAPLPQRISSEPPINAIVVALGRSDNDLKATTNLYDPSLGQRTSDQSGVAITALQKQGELSNSHYLGNMQRAIRTTGKLLVDLIPEYYDAPQIRRIIGEDETAKLVMVHSGASQQEIAAVPKAPEIKVFDLSKGRFKVVVSSGPSTGTKRQEAATALSEFVRVYPNAFPLLGDIIVRNLDFPGNVAASKRLKRMVPPQALSPEDQEPGDQPAVPPELAQKMQQMGQELQQTQALLAKATEEINSRAVDLEIAKIKADADVRDAELRANATLISAWLKLGGDVQSAKFQASVRRLEQLLDHAHDRGLAAADQVHAAIAPGREALAQHLAPQQPAASPELEPAPGGAVPPAGPAAQPFVPPGAPAPAPAQP